MIKEINLGKSFETMKLIKKIKKELSIKNDLATLGLRQELKKPQPNFNLVIKELKDTINDGYGGLSIYLTNEIKNF